MQVRRNEGLEQQLLDGMSARVHGGANSVDVTSSSTSSPYLSPHIRSVGPHVSGIIADIATQTGLLRRVVAHDSQGGGDDGSFIQMAGTGLIWEDIISKQLASQQGIQPGQFECVVDGIIGTPDRFRPGTGEVDEFKATWLSTSNDIIGERCWRWWAQVKAYCYMLNTRWANLWVFYINGDYKPPRPEIRVYSVMFDDDEMRRNWELIKNHNAAMIARMGDWWLSERH